MFRRLLLSAFLCAGLVLGAAGPARAKGPTEATVTGPALGRPLVVTERLSDLMKATGAEELVYRAPSGLTFARRAPTVALGPRHLLRYTMGDQAVLEQHLYLSAAGGPVVYTPPRQHNIFMLNEMEGGWRRVDDGIRRLLHELGLPAVATAATASPAAAGKSAGAAVNTVPGAAIVAGLSLGVLVVAGGFAWRARRRRPIAGSA